MLEVPEDAVRAPESDAPEDGQRDGAEGGNDEERVHLEEVVHREGAEALVGGVGAAVELDIKAGSGALRLRAVREEPYAERYDGDQDEHEDDVGSVAVHG